MCSWRTWIKNPGKLLLLFRSDADPKIIDFIFQRMDTDEYQLVFELFSWAMVERP